MEYSISQRTGDAISVLDIACGHCNQRCPFHVDQIARMKEIAKYFEEA